MNYDQDNDDRQNNSNIEGLININTHTDKIDNKEIKNGAKDGVNTVDMSESSAGPGLQDVGTEALNKIKGEAVIKTEQESTGATDGLSVIKPENCKNYNNNGINTSSSNSTGNSEVAVINENIKTEVTLKVEAVEAAGGGGVDDKRKSNRKKATDLKNNDKNADENPPPQKRVKKEELLDADVHAKTDTDASDEACSFMCSEDTTTTTGTFIDTFVVFVRHFGRFIHTFRRK